MSLVKFISQSKLYCTTIHRYPIFSSRFSIMCKVYTEYHGTSEIEHCLCACTVDNPLAKAQELSHHTGAQTMLYLSLIAFLQIKSLIADLAALRMPEFKILFESGARERNKFSIGINNQTSLKLLC